MRLLFRRMMKRLRKQEWVAIGIDFLIVVIGVFIAMQVSNWNAQGAERRHARELTQALRVEFTDIERELETSLGNITRYQAASRSLVTALRNDTVPSDSDQVKTWILNSINLGRQSPRSAVYLQMVSDGDLQLIDDPKLTAALVRFDQRIERNAFVYAGTLSIMFSDDSLFDAAEFNDTGALRGAGRTVLSYDRERLKAAESRIEAASLAQSSLRTSVAEQLADARAILVLLKKPAA
ncbi:hypothetical protein [Brevundimonas sp.]|uniref:hypothetical protein n=1 Tax=Brevundimonas sp. TaxID=1871086 RepID=UPI002FDA6333